ncbi:MAG TPA: DUF1343 domain-containing protein [Spirillospora sp.]|nr:DUF1343 domain-containing protein [Spirillospora sp.]
MNIRLGLEVLLDQKLDLLEGRRVGLVASPSSIDHDLRSTVERLHRQPEINLVALFGPEHGLRGDAQAGKHVDTYTDPLTGLPVYSLYGETRTPTAEMLQNLDTIVIDLQDGGVRFYTYLATMTHVMEAAAAHDCAVIVLDRPAPINAATVEGPVLDPAYRSFVGPYPIPVRYGMTIGEMARLVNTHFGIGCDLTVVTMQGWSRSLWFDQTDVPFVPPSPNLPTLSALTVYPGTCLIEGTNISEGRGTTKPFEYIGAPWIEAERLAAMLNDLDRPGVRFRPVYFVPTFSKYADELCAGVQVYVTDRDCFRPFETALYILQVIKTTYPKEFSWRDPWRPGDRKPIDLLCGGTMVREHLDANSPITELAAAWQEEVRAYSQLRASYLLYADP